MIAPINPDTTIVQPQGAKMRETYISQRVASLKPSGIRRFFDLAATMSDVISLGIGEPDFDSPRPVIEAGIRALENHATHYTSNAGILTLRKALTANIERLYGVSYDPADEALITVGGSERSEEHTSELQSPKDLVCSLLL